ncbi:MAG: helix-turn-helix domain-containing protein [Ruminococcaceae bacterium]|nr:helix-turn-helix domain-containing protein [Oscillospiraceae bacterium]
MFDMKEIGARIARYRRQKNLTQMSLADNLGISFQAVSNWERGESMPDISKLGELSQVLGVSIDVLLGNVPSYSDPVETVENEAEKIEVSTDTVPEVDVKVDVQVAEDSVENVEKPESNDVQREYVRRIMATIEYMDSDDVAEIVSDLLEKGAAFEDITPALDHLDSDDVAEIATECLKNGATLSDVNLALEYMDSDDIAEMVDIALENGEAFDAVSFAFEYMDSEDISEFVKASVKKSVPKKSKEAHYDDLAREAEAKEEFYDGHAKKAEGRFGDIFDNAMDLLSLAFTKKEKKQSSESYTVDTETGEVTENSGKTKNLNAMCSMFPFLGEDEVTRLVKENYEAGATFNSLCSAFPFMHQNALEEIVISELKKGVGINDVAAAFPFVSIEFMKKIADGKY